jgi:hypothetical protein
MLSTAKTTAAPVAPGVPAPGGDCCNPTNRNQKGTTMLQPPADPDQSTGPNLYPVDSATQQCCQGIGAHTPDCATDASRVVYSLGEAKDAISSAVDHLADVPIPPGASADIISGWEDWGNEFRIVYTPERRVSGHDYVVQGSALQFPDGHVDDGTLDKDHPPGIWLQSSSATDLTICQARELAALISSTADDLDTWSRDRHRCPFSWCTTQPSPVDTKDHWSGVTYTPASLRHGDPYHLRGDKDPLKVGVVVSYVEGNMPAVGIHLDGGKYDYDYDAFLRLDEAYELRRLLDDAIDRATEAVSHMCAAITAKGVG